MPAAKLKLSGISVGTTLIALAVVCLTGLAGCTKRYFGVRSDTPNQALVAVWRDWPIHIASVNGESAYPAFQLTRVPLYVAPGEIVIESYYHDTAQSTDPTEPIAVKFNGGAGEVWLLCSEIQANRWRPVITMERSRCPMLRFHPLRQSVYGEPMEFDPNYRPAE